MSREYEHASILKQNYAEIADIAEKYFSWLRITAVFQKSGFAADNAVLERMICDFAGVSKVTVPNAKLINFMNKWRKLPLVDACRWTTQVVVEEFYAGHPELFPLR